MLAVSCHAVKKGFDPSYKISANDAQADLDVLQNVLQRHHPGLYWYTSKDSIDFFFSLTRNLLKDSITEIQYKNRIAWLLAKIKCGHTVVRHTVDYSNFFRNKRLPQFPLSVKLWKDSAVVIGSFNRRDSIFTRGTILTAINTRSIAQLRDSMFQLIGTDGNANNFKYQLISFNFGAHYRNTFGADSNFVVDYIDSLGIPHQVIIKHYDPSADTLFRRRPAVVQTIPPGQQRRLQKLSKRNVRIDTAMQTAYLAINTFSDGHLQNFYRRTFTSIRKQGIKNVVIDLRQNSGGSVLSSTKLSQYLVKKSFKVADTVAAYTRHFPDRRYIKPWFIYWLSMHTTGKKNRDGRIHFSYFERHYFQPKNKNHFDGNIVLVTGGYTFSAATLFTNTLKGQPNVTVVGEETGGGAYGNNAMHLPTIFLPKTKLRITLPLYRMVLNASHPKDGRGILPDVVIDPSSNYIKHGIDPKLEKIRTFILEKNAAAGTN